MRLGWSVPRVRQDPFRSRAMRLPAYLVAAVARRLFPRRARKVIAAGYCDAIMAHWRLATPALVRAVRDAGGELYVWTVDELPRILELEALGVTGVVSNDPRLFSSSAADRLRPAGPGPVSRRARDPALLGAEVRRVAEVGGRVPGRGAAAGLAQQLAGAPPDELDAGVEQPGVGTEGPRLTALLEARCGSGPGGPGVDALDSGRNLCFLVL